MGRRMKILNKTIILPIISAVAIIIKNVFHIEVGDETINAVSDLVLGGITVYGIIKNHFSPKV
jgi:hypothetical protein